MDKKICAICLSNKRPMLVRAAWQSSELFFDNPVALPTRRAELEAKTLETALQLADKGFQIIIEESTSFVSSRVGNRVRLRDIADDNRPVLVAAHDAYNELLNQSAIVFPAKSQAFRLPDSIFDEERDGKGAVTFNIDWDSLKSEHVLTLLACYATIWHNPSSSNFLQAMFGNQAPAEKEKPRTLQTIIDYQNSITEGMPSSPLTGKAGFL
jgi:hypothetical protein